MNKRIIIFFHLAKTGGVTLKKILKRQVPRDSRFYKLNISSVDDKAALEPLKSLPREKKNKIAVLAGHMPFGLHEYFSVPCDYITILRDPAEVITSAYYHIKNDSADHRYWRREIPRLDTMSLSDFVTSNFSLTHNHQTRLLSGEFKTFFEPAGPLAADALRRAKQNLRNNFRVVGVTERFDETLMVMKKTFGWRNVLYSQANTTPAKKRAGGISPEIREIVMKNNELDFELWRFSGTLLEESMSRYGPSFQDDLRRFRKINAVYQAAEANIAYRGMYRIFLFGKAVVYHSRRFLSRVSHPKL